MLEFAYSCCKDNEKLSYNATFIEKNVEILGVLKKRPATIKGDCSSRLINSWV